MITIKSLGLTEANLVIQAGITRANEIGSPSTIAVVDVGGTIVAQARMDGASLSSVALAYNKAYTSLSCRLATSEITKIAQPGGDFYGIANGLAGRAIIFPGGIPIEVEGKVVGGRRRERRKRRPGRRGGTRRRDQPFEQNNPIWRRTMKTILITGAGSGLNNGAAFELAERGYDVIACVEIYPQVRALELQAKERGVKLRIEKIDVTKEGDRRRAMSWDIDVLVNGAGIIEGGAIVDIPSENMRRQFEVNVIGPVLLTQGIARKMIKRRSGKIIFMSSVVGILSGPFVGIYGASKHAIEAIADTMSMELQEFGIQVAVINPGPYLTGFNDAGFLAPKDWDDDPSARVFDYDKLAFPFEQFEPQLAFSSIVDVITGESSLFRNVITPDLSEGVRKQSLQVWTRKITDGLGTRAELVQKSYDLKPETLVGSR
jgi:NAD(P)-dependent dehydrogenase (short-subunit alcohol dehydrogenase family)/uncharacterized protein GlcG (DUF336 family)